MIATNATREDLQHALDAVNKKYGGNIKFRNFDSVSKNRVRFTLTVKNSGGKGARRSAKGQKTSAACWHVHGDFFDELIKANDAARVLVGARMVDGRAARIDKDGGNGQDWNIGSQAYPLMHSEACDCGN